MHKPKIIFIGTPEFSAIILKKLINSQYKPIACITQTDKKIGRKQEIKFSPVKKVCLENKILVLQFDRFDQNSISQIKNIDPDLIIVAAYGKILPKDLINLPKLNCINIHPSLLPKYRGASPIQSALLNGDQETGVTIMKMNEKMDAGPILYQKKIKIYNKDTNETLHNKLANVSADFLLEKLPTILKNKVKLKNQEEPKATYTKIINKSDGQINWLDSAEKIDRQFRAYYPWPGIFTFFKKNNKNLRLKIKSISILDPKIKCPNKAKPGDLFKTTDNKLAIFCGQGSLILEKVQIEGKKEIKGSEFLKGYQDIKNFK